MRFPHWPQALADSIQAAGIRVFGYGGFDCCLFCADVVESMTGVDYAASLRGYATEDEAYEIISGYGSIEAMVTSLLGREPIHPSSAGRGDVVLMEIDGRETLGICLGVRSAFPQHTGLRQHLTWLARCAWRID